MMIFQPRNPVAFLPGSDVYMDNWCDIKCRKGPNGSKYFFRTKKYPRNGSNGCLPSIRSQSKVTKQKSEKSSLITTVKIH